MSNHRKIIEFFISRKLNSNEHVHHINLNCNDNRIENLIVCNPDEHIKMHQEVTVILLTLIENGIIKFNNIEKKYYIDAMG